MNSCFEHRGGGLVAKSCSTLVIPWTVACQAPLSIGFSRQGYWSELPFPSPGDLPNPGIELKPPALATGLFITCEVLRKALYLPTNVFKSICVS